MRYLLLLRGVNVGGNSKVVMAEFRTLLFGAGFEDVTSYINSGNLLFTSNLSSAKVTQHIQKILTENYDFSINFTLIDTRDWKASLQQIPTWWGQNPEWRHNVLFKLPGYEDRFNELVKSEITDDNDLVQIENRLIFWSSPAKKNYSRSFYSKLLKTPLYKNVSIRNRNTTLKLNELLLDKQNLN